VLLEVLEPEPHEKVDLTKIGAQRRIADGIVSIRPPCHPHFRCYPKKTDPSFQTGRENKTPGARVPQLGDGYAADMADAVERATEPETWLETLTGELVVE